MRGVRIRTILRELGRERVDIVRWSEEPSVFIANALSPAKCEEVKLNSEREATVILADDQLSLAIGKKGLNVKLASKVCSCKINVRNLSQVKKEFLPAIIVIKGIGEKTAKKLAQAGFAAVKELAEARIEELTKVSAIGKKRAARIIAAAKEKLSSIK